MPGLLLLLGVPLDLPPHLLWSRAQNLTLPAHTNFPVPCLNGLVSATLLVSAIWV